MTLAEFMEKPRDLSIEQWEKQLARKKRTERRLKKLLDQRDMCKDALEVLADEKGSNRWITWNDRLVKILAEIVEIVSEK